jgi:hypothetical protein
MNESENPISKYKVSALKVSFVNVQMQSDPCDFGEESYVAGKTGFKSTRFRLTSSRWYLQPRWIFDKYIQFKSSRTHA